MNDLDIVFPPDEEINHRAAVGIMGKFLSESTPQRGYLELTTHDITGARVTILKSDNRIYNSRIVANNCSPFLPISTRKELDDFIKSVAQAIADSMDGKWESFVTMVIFSVKDVNLQDPTEIRRWKITKGLIGSTGKTPPS